MCPSIAERLSDITLGKIKKVLRICVIRGGYLLLVAPKNEKK